MAVASKLIPFLLSLRRFLVRALRAGVLRQALKWLLRRLAFYWTAFRLKWGPSRENTKVIDSPPPPKVSGQHSGEAIAESDDKQQQKEALEPDFKYTLIDDGKTISLHDAMLSFYPLSGDGIRSPSRSSMNLRASRSAHSLAISARTSTQSINGGDPVRAMSRSPTISIHNVEDGGDYTFTVQDGSPTLPSPPFNPINLAPPPRSPHLRPTDSQSRLSSRIGLSGFDSQTTSPTLEVKDLELDTRPSLRRETSQSDDIKSRTSSYFPADDSRSDISSQSFHQPDDRTSTNMLNDLKGSESSACLNNSRIVPVMPEGMSFSRYCNRPKIPRDSSEMTIQPLSMKFEKPEPPSGWIKLVHPEGGCYFFHQEKRVHAEANLYDPLIHSQAMKDIATLGMFVSPHKFDDALHRDTELVICLNLEGTEILTTYYYVHHASRSIFFLDDYEASNLVAWNELDTGATSENHLRHEIESQYWYHCQLFPHSSNLTKEKVCELRDVVLHFIGDTMTSPKCSTAPHSLEDLEKLLGYANEMEKNVGSMSVGAHSCFARLMFIFSRAKFLHYHGEQHARIDRTVSVHDKDVNRRTWLVKSLSPLLFSAPDFHLRNLQSMWVDGITHKSIFKEAMGRMNEEWDQFVLFATVMLNANVAFLAIQSVDNSQSPNRSAAQISSYTSMIASIGSIVLGLLLSRQNKTKVRQTVEDFEKYMSKRHHPILGLETLAILYSLPYALLMWAMVTFLLAISFLCFFRSDIPTRSTVGISSALCVVLIVWCVWTNWESEEMGNGGEMEEQSDSELTDREQLCPTVSTLLSFFLIPTGRQRTDSQQQQIA